MADLKLNFEGTVPTIDNESGTLDARGAGSRCLLNGNPGLFP